MISICIALPLSHGVPLVKSLSICCAMVHFSSRNAKALPIARLSWFGHRAQKSLPRNRKGGRRHFYDTADAVEARRCAGWLEIGLGNVHRTSGNRHLERVEWGGAPSRQHSLPVTQPSAGMAGRELHRVLCQARGNGKRIAPPQVRHRSVRARGYSTHTVWRDLLRRA
jgi:hypothetical protein